MTLPNPPLTLEQRAEFDRIRSDRGEVAAVAYVRRVLDLPFSEALEIVASVLGWPCPPATDATSAEIIAVGPFRLDVADFLEYGAEMYADTREGATVIVTVACVLEDSAATRALARSFGIDPWDFNAHELDPWRADLDSLRTVSGEERPVETLVALREAGFRFYFNGPYREG